MELIKAAVNSVSTYAGSDIQKTAYYIATKLKQTDNLYWNAIVLNPNATISGSQFCPENSLWVILNGITIFFQVIFE